MKKIILWALLTFSLFSIVQDVGAVSFGGSSTVSLPYIYKNNNIIVDNTVNGSAFGYTAYQNTSNASFQEYVYFACFVYDHNSGSGTIFYNGFSDSSSNPGTFDTSFVGVEYLIHSVPGTNKYGFYQTVWNKGNAVAVDSFVDFLPQNPDSGGASPTKGVLCIKTQFYWNISNGGVIGLYLYGIGYSYYNASNGAMDYKYTKYDNSNFGLYIGVNAGNALIYSSDGFDSGNLTSSGTRVFYRSSPSPVDEGVIDEFMINTGSLTDNHLYSWLGSSSLSTTIFSGGTGSTSSGSTNYYSDCMSFLDVGCYIAGTASRFSDSITQWKDNLVSWFLPDINFNGMSDTCLTSLSGSGNTLSGSTISASGVTTGMIQKVVNLFGILLPVAPVDGSQVCLIDGTIQTIDYDDRTNILDIMLVLTVFFSAFISIAHSKKHD